MATAKDVWQQISTLRTPSSELERMLHGADKGILPDMRVNCSQCRLQLSDKIEWVERAAHPGLPDSFAGYRLMRGVVVGVYPPKACLPSSYNVRVTSATGARSEVHRKGHLRLMGTKGLYSIACYRVLRADEKRKAV